MTSHNCKQDCASGEGSIGGFPLADKVLLRIAFYGFVVVGAYALFLESFLWGIVYTGFALLWLGLVGYFLCAHCPHPFQYSDCLFLPWRVITKIYTFRPEPVSTLDTVGIVIMTVGLVGIPQYWLLQSPGLLAGFWVLYGFFGAGVALRICRRRCLHRTCPLHPERRST